MLPGTDGHIVHIAVERYGRYWRPRPPLGAATDDPERLAAWVAKLPAAEKDRLLVGVAQDHARKTTLIGRLNRANL
jgi:hypothetical protein